MQGRVVGGWSSGRETGAAGLRVDGRGQGSAGLGSGRLE